MSIPRIFPVGLCALGSVAVCFAQTPVTFSPVLSESQDTPANIYAVDLNNDGITDIVQDTAYSPAGFTVSIGNGDGTFKTPVHYNLPTTLTGVMSIATGDFNNDGKVDVAVTLEGTDQVAVYLGNGDGSLQSPKISTLLLTSGFTWVYAGSAAADFNGDGKLDLVAYAGSFSGATSTATQLYVLQGDGAGGFSNPRMLLSGPPLFTQLVPQFQVFVGDFDSDGRADIATTQPTKNNAGGVANTTLHVLYGNNDFTFGDTTPYVANGSLTIAAGDLNSDGFTDLFGDNGTQLAVFYGNASRTFNSYFPPLGTSSGNNVGAISDSWEWTPQYAMADFNGDGRMDLAVFFYSVSSTLTAYIRFYLAGANPGEFTRQDFPLPSGFFWDTSPVASLFGNLLTPSLVLNQSVNGSIPPYNSPSVLTTELNKATSGWFGPCYYPKSSQGFDVCAPGTVTGSTAHFSAAVNSFGKLRKVELWVDGKKVSEQHHTWDQHGYFNYSAAFAAGTHQATFYAADVDNRLQRYDFNFSMGGGCSAPSSPGVNICSPVNNSTVSSPEQVLATANITGSLARMEVWLDGVKVYTETASTTLSTSIPLGAGKHQFGVYAVNTAGTKWLSIVYATVP